MSVPSTLVFAPLYLVTVLAGQQTVLDSIGEPMIWPAAGVAAVWLVVRDDARGRWLDIPILGVLTVAGLAVTGMSPGMAALHGVTAVVFAMVFAVAAGRWLPGLWGGDQLSGGGRPLTQLGELWGLVLSAVLASLASTVLEVGGETLASGEFSASAAFVVASRDVGAVLIFGVAARRLGFLANGHWRRVTNSRLGLECIAVFGVSVPSYYYIFGVNHTVPIGFILLPLTVWAAVRLPTTLTILHTMVFTCIAGISTLSGRGPFVVVADEGTRAFVVQLYVGVLAVVGLVIALARDEREALIRKMSSSEEEATEKAGLMTTIVNSMTEGLAILDPAGKLILRNPAGGRILGNLNTVAGGGSPGTDHGFFHPDGTPLKDDELPYARALAGEDVEPMDIMIRNSAAPEGRIVRFNVARIAVHTGGAQHVVVVFHDVTTDRRHRDELMSFAGRVAHDLLNPLTTIEGWAEVLEQELAGYKPAERVNRIQRAAARMRTFLNGLLAYTAARDGKLILTTVNLALMVGDIVNSRLDQADSAGTAPPSFEVGQLDPVEADPVLIRQLLENLIDNALALVPPGVGAYVSISSQQAPNGMLRIDVLDNGVGLPENARREIFTNFHRGEGMSTGGGNGLELAICKRIVDRHGGAIEAMANPYGSGTRMSFTLPAGRSAYARALGAQRVTPVR
ncbi:hypothetical protein Acsp01_77180 [Actinoplanes sp. NBRC 101535]|nr:hypothetical protein Acsp01_77180 [Actinoplanes sp. NBRC 101535]